jgi:hypothetical protein
MRMTRQNKKTAEIVTATTAVAIAVCASRCVLTADAPAADTPPVQTAPSLSSVLTSSGLTITPRKGSRKSTHASFSSAPGWSSCYFGARKCLKARVERRTGVAHT